jgi:hypothetical protein
MPPTIAAGLAGHPAIVCCTGMTSVTLPRLVNLHNSRHPPYIDQIQGAYDKRTLLSSQKMENTVVFAVKGRRLRTEDESIEELVRKFRADTVLVPSLIQF